MFLDAIRARGNVEDAEDKAFARALPESTLCLTNTFGCGNNKYGRLGVNDNASKRSWTRGRVACEKHDIVFERLACGAGHVLAADADGRLYTWGKCHFGQLGHGRENQDRWLPSPLALPRRVAAFGAGDSFSLAVDAEDGAVYAFGCGFYGPLALGDERSPTVPTRVPFFDSIPVASVTGGAFHSVFCAQDGRLFTCGRNQCGQLGDGTTTSRKVPVAVLAGTTVAQVAAGETCTVAVDDAGTAHWFGALGEQGKIQPHPTRLVEEASKACCSNTSILVLLASGSCMHHFEGLTKELAHGGAPWVDICAGEMHFMALDSVGRLWSWGESYQGKLAQGPGARTTSDPTLTSAPGLQGQHVTALAAGSNHTLVLARSRK